MTGCAQVPVAEETPVADAVRPIVGGVDVTRPAGPTDPVVIGIARTGRSVPGLETAAGFACPADEVLPSNEAGAAQLGLVEHRVEGTWTRQSA